MVEVYDDVIQRAVPLVMFADENYRVNNYMLSA